MTSSQSPQKQGLAESAEPFSDGKAKRIVAILGLVTLMFFFAAAMPAPIRAAWDQFALAVQLRNDPLPATAAQLSDHEIAEIAAMASQDQAERLLQRAINHYDGALDLITKYVDSWYGQLELQAKLTSLLTTALNSDDLRVRSAALEVELAGYNLQKTSASADLLMERVRTEPSARPWALWMLGVLGNRGVEPRKVFSSLMDHRHDPEEQTRYWVMEGLSMLGTDDTVAPLLEAFRSDASPLVRERAASALSRSGMLTKEQRLRAVPGLLRMSDDTALDATTRNWVFQALRDITGAAVGSDASAWRAWWAQKHHGRA